MGAIKVDPALIKARETAILRAQYCGPLVADPDHWRLIPEAAWAMRAAGEDYSTLMYQSPAWDGLITKGDVAIRWIQKNLIVPEGPLMGQPLSLDPYQTAFVYAIFDNPVLTKKAILSVGRRNGKTLVIGAILWLYIAGPFAVRNSVVASAAMSRDQAKVAFRLMKLMAGNRLTGKYRVVPSSGTIVGLLKNVEYIPLARDAKTGHGKSIRVLLLDEAGQIEAPTDDFLDMLFTSQGSYEDAVTFIVSTQAATDSAFLSLEIDAAKQHQPEDVVCHVYASSQDCKLDDEIEWTYSNPGLAGGFRTISDLRKLSSEAKQMPSKQNGFRNLNLNNRVSLLDLAFSADTWKACCVPIQLETFKKATRITLGLDLSEKTDLTAAVLAAQDPDTGDVDVMPFTFSPTEGLAQRAMRDKAPYQAWVDAGQLHLCPGGIIDYDFLFQFLALKFEEYGFWPTEIVFDRWRINEAKAAAARAGFAPNATWIEWGQGFKDMGVALNRFEERLIKQTVRLGMDPALNMGAASSIVQYDPAGNRKLIKADSTKAHSHRRRIDTLVACVMAVAPFEEEGGPVDVSGWIG